MAQKNKMLTFAEIVARADAQTLKEALEARLQIDELLLQREEAYRQIAEVEEKVQAIAGDELEFEFDEPQVAIAWGGKSPKKKKAKTVVVSAPVIEEKLQQESGESSEEDEVFPSSEEVAEVSEKTESQE